MARKPERARRSPGVLDPALLVISVVLAALIAVVTVLVATSASRPVWVNLLFPATAAVYAAAGILAWRRRPANGFGALLVVGSLIWVAASCSNVDARPLVAVGLITATLSVAFVIHLLLAFPSGVLGGPVPRTIVAAIYGVCTVLQAPLYLFRTAPPPWNVLIVAERPNLADLGYDVQRLTGSAVVIAAGVLLVRRMWRASPEQRRVLLPLVAYGILAALLIPVTANWLGPAVRAIPLVVTQVALLAGVPLAFFLSLQRGASGPPRCRTAGGLAGPGRRDPSGAGRGPRRHARGPVHAVALRRHAGSDHTGSRSRGGRARRPPGRVHLVRRHADPRARTGAPGGQVVALAIDRDRLTASLRSSRARIVQAGDAERRRIAADLHDGLQANLVMLSLQAYELGESPAADARGPGHTPDRVLASTMRRTACAASSTASCRRC